MVINLKDNSILVNKNSQNTTLSNLGLRPLYSQKGLVVIVKCLVSCLIISSHANDVFTLSIYYFFFFNVSKIVTIPSQREPFTKLNPFSQEQL